jgi:hypothetical protein
MSDPSQDSPTSFTLPSPQYADDEDAAAALDACEEAEVKELVADDAAESLELDVDVGNPQSAEQFNSSSPAPHRASPQNPGADVDDEPISNAPNKNLPIPFCVCTCTTTTAIVMPVNTPTVSLPRKDLYTMR